ncbi:hypothetical protein [Timonella sp. A28]|uniref:hypothetical protein n=1 Tax=Timonella sp. A28 TaxID=3442640 RepID=UPI003EC04622
MWDVRVDSSGFSLRSVLGIPKKHIPLAEIESAHVVQVSPFRDFGGWGWRSNLDGTVGVVLRRGDALEIHSSGGRKFLITVDEAEQAAGLLNSLVERSRS